jgi:hypothetical protein
MSTQPATGAPAAPAPVAPATGTTTPAPGQVPGTGAPVDPPVSTAPLTPEEAAELRKEIVALRKEAATAG